MTNVNMFTVVMTADGGCSLLDSEGLAVRTDKDPRALAKYAFNMLGADAVRWTPEAWALSEVRR